MRIQYYLACICMLVVSFSSLNAQTQYIGPDNGDWFTASNWNNGLPAAGNNALIGGGVTVLVGSPLTIDFTLTLFANITATAPVTVAAGGVLSNSGTFTFGAGSSLTNNATVQNFGTMSLSAGANFTNEAGASFTNGGPLNVSSTLVNKGSFTNNNTIDALNGTVQTQGTFDNNQTLNTKSLSVSTGSTFTNNFGANLNITGAGATLQVDGLFTNNGTLNASGTMTVNGNFQNNVTLNAAAGTVVTINASAQLNNNGTLDNSGFLQLYGTLTNGNTLVNRGETNIFGTLNNNNLIDNKTGATFFNRAGGTLGMGFGSKLLNAGAVTNQNAINSFGTLENNGTFTNNGTLLSFGGSNFDNNATFTNSGTLSTNDVASNDGTFTNNGTLNVNGGSAWSNFATFVNATGATVNVVQDFTNKSTGTLTNNGTFRNSVRTRNEGSFTNNAYLLCIGDITNTTGATLTNAELFLLQAGNLANAGTFANSDKTLADECSSISNTGSINNTGGNLELHGILFQRGTISGNAVNNQGGYIHTNLTSNAPSVCQNGTYGANIDGDIKVYAGSLVAFENFDSCGNIVYLANGIDRPVFHCADIPTVQNLNLVVRTRLGDSLTCVAQVTPVDLLEPQFNTCPKDQVIFTPNNSATASWTAPTATDNCTTVNVTSTHTPGSSFPVGITGVTYTAKDLYNNQNQCQFRIDVRMTPPGSNCTGDTAGPTFTGCPANITTPRLAPLTIVTWAPPTPNDNCKPITLTSTHVPGQGFPVGTTTVTYTAKDGSNNSSTCSFTVTVTTSDPCQNDTQKPVFSNCPANIWLPTNPTINGAVAYWNAPGVGDNCAVTDLTASHAPGAVFPVGTTTVTYTAKDAANNGSTCSFTVTVGADPCPGDATGPAISGCPANINLTTNGTSATATWTAPTATDPCTPVTTNNNYAPGASFPLGATQVSYRFSDKKGNLSTCNFTVTVQNTCAADNVAPVITGCPANITVAAGPNGTATATWTPPTATDNCGLSSFQSAYLPGATFPTGVTTVVYSALDLKGNAANCQFNVTVITAPGCTANSAPINNTTGVNVSSAVLSWGTAQFATSYDVYLGTTNPPTTLVASNVSTTNYTASNLLGNTNYWWYVVPKNAAGSATGCSSSATKFTTATVACTGCTGNLLTDGCFENGITGFTTAATVALTSPGYNSNWDVDVSGSSGKLMFTTSATVGGVYTFSTRSRISNTSKCGAVYMRFRNASGTTLATFSTFINTGNFSLYTVSGTAPANTTQVLISVEKCGSGGTISTDDWCLTAVLPCNPLTSAGSISGNQSVCSGGNPSVIVEAQAPAGGSGTIQYQWLQSTTSCPTSVSTQAIAGATSMSYDPPALTQTTYYVRAAKYTNCTTWSLSNCVTITVNGTSTPTAICQNITRQMTAPGQSVQISGADVNNGSLAGCGATITSLNVSPTSFSAPGNYTVTLTVTNSLGLSSTCTATVTILAAPCTVSGTVCEANVNDSGWQNLSACAISVCVGNKVILSVNPNGLPSYQWSGPNGYTATGNSGGDALISTSITAAHAGNYTVTMTDANGCTATKTIAVTVTNCNTCNGNLLVNPGFENGTSGWTWSQNATTTTTSPYAGSRSLQICTPEGGISQYMSAIPGTAYSLKVFAKVNSSVTWAGIGIKFYDANWATISQPSTQVTATSYTQYTVSATAPANAAFVEVWVWKDYAGCFWADDFCFTSSLGFPACSNNALANENPGFENNFISWDWTDDATITTTNYYAGTKAAQVCTVSGGAGNNILATPGATYSLQLRAKVSGTIDWAGAGIAFYDANWNSVGGDISRGITATDWSLYLIQGVAPINAKYVEFWFWKEYGGCMYVDEFCVTTTGGCNNGALLVVGNTTLGTGDVWVKNRLQSLGLNVTVKSATSVTTADASGNGVVVISSTVNSTDVNTKFTNVPVPVVTWESYLLDDLKMTGTVAQTDYGQNASYHTLTFTNSTHPLAAGLSGNVQVYTSGNYMRWGWTTSSSAIKIATVTGQEGWLGVFGYAQGASMQGGFTAPNRRVSIFLDEETPTLLTTNGKLLFDAAIEWAVGCNLLHFGTEQVEERGNEEFILAKPTEHQAVQVFPNPATDWLTLEFSAGSNDEATIRLFDINGKAVSEWEVEPSTEPIELKLQGIQSGQYLLWIAEKGQKPVSKRVVVANRP